MWVTGGGSCPHNSRLSSCRAADSAAGLTACSASARSCIGRQPTIQATTNGLALLIDRRCNVRAPPIPSILASCKPSPLLHGHCNRDHSVRTVGSCFHNSAYKHAVHCRRSRIPVGQPCRARWHSGSSRFVALHQLPLQSAPLRTVTAPSALANTGSRPMRLQNGRFQRPAAHRVYAASMGPPRGASTVAASSRHNNPNRRLSGSTVVSVDVPEDQPAAPDPRMQSVVKVETTHAVPSFTRPWDREFEVQSTSSAFLVDINRRLLMTTAGAVEWSRRIIVTRWAFLFT